MPLDHDLVVDLAAESPDQAALLAKLGNYEFGKACLYFRRPADLDLKILEQLAARSLATHTS